MCYRYIKELAERVGALETERLQRSPEVPYANIAPVAHHQQHGLPINYSESPVDNSYGSRKRTHSSSQGLHTEPFLEGQGHEVNDNGPSHAFGSHWSKGLPSTDPRTQSLDIDERAPSSQPPLDRNMAPASDAVEQTLLKEHATEEIRESINL